MFGKKKKYKVRKYKKPVKIPFETYEPEKKIELRKEQAVPFLVRVCNCFLFLGGMIGFFVSSLLMGIKGFFGFQEKLKSTEKYRVVKYENRDI